MRTKPNNVGELIGPAHSSRAADNSPGSSLFSPFFRIIFLLGYQKGSFEFFCNT